MNKNNDTLKLTKIAMSWKKVYTMYERLRIHIEKIEARNRLLEVQENMARLSIERLFWETKLKELEGHDGATEAKL